MIYLTLVIFKNLETIWIKIKKLALKERKSLYKKVIRVEEKGSRFMVLSSNDYESKVQHQTQCSSFTETDFDYSKNFEEKVNS